MNSARFQLEPEKAAAAAVFNLADALQNLLFYAKVDNLSPATRAILKREYRALKTVADFYGIGQGLEFNPLPGTPFTKKTGATR